MEYKRAKVLQNSYLYYGSFYKCKLALKKGEIWDMRHDGSNFCVLERFNVTIELTAKDFEEHFETMDD